MVSEKAKQEIQEDQNNKVFLYNKILILYQKLCQENQEFFCGVRLRTS